VITDIAAFLHWFGGVNRRAVRDIGSLPDEALTWKPPSGTGEDAWSIAELVAHMAASRLMFARAYRGEGWLPELWPHPTDTREQWIDALTMSAGAMQAQLETTPDEWLRRRIEPVETPGHAISGWRVLMMGVEHDIHHRSQIDTYAGIAGWEVQQIFGRTAEEAGLSPRR